MAAVMLADHGVKLERWENVDGLGMTFRLEVAGRTFTRVLSDGELRDGALDIPAMYWRHAERADAFGEELAALTGRCLAIERIFPDARELLPA